MTDPTGRRRRRSVFDRFSTRTLIELLVVVILSAGLGVSVVSSLSASAAAHSASTSASADEASLTVLKGQAKDLGAAVNTAGDSLTKALGVLANRSPTYTFFVCWSARVGDLFNALPALNSAASPAQLRVFSQIAAATRTALTLTTQGGCLDPTVPVTIPLPVTIPPK